ncbi:MAG: hypothetical protein IPH42_20600 [Bacteroidetes bacterium]|nr:hypothetical protein [Bacteroidota bacterium]
MEEQIIKIDTGTAKVLDLDADGKGLYLAFLQQRTSYLKQQKRFYQFANSIPNYSHF